MRYYWYPVKNIDFESNMEVESTQTSARVHAGKHHSLVVNAVEYSLSRYFKDLDFSIAKEGYVKEVRLADWDGDGDQAGSW